MSTPSHTNRWRALRAAAAGWLARRKALLDHLAHPRLAPWRRPFYRLSPGFRVAAALYIARTGALTQARRELEPLPGMGKSARDLARRLDGMLAVLAGAPPLPDLPPPSKPKAGPKAGPVLMALSNSLPHHKAGYARRTDAILKALQDQGIAVAAATRPNYPFDLLRTRPADEATAGFPYRRLIAPTAAINRSPDDAYIAAYAEALVETARDTGAALLHAHSDFMNGLAAAIAGRRLGLPVVYEARGLWYLTQAADNPAFADSELARYRRRMELAALDAADAVVAIAGSLRDELVRQGVPAAKIRVMANAVDPTRFAPRPADLGLARALGMAGRTVVGFAGTLNGYEGVDVLIDAVARLVAEGLDLGLVVAGDGPAAEAWRRRARPLGNRAVFTGHVDFAGVEALYALFDICPLPRLDLPVCRVVPPLKALETMAMAKPLVVSALPPLVEFGVEGESRLSCPPGDATALAAAIRRLTLDPGERRRLGWAGRAWVGEHRTWRTVGRRYADLYRELGLFSVSSSSPSPA